MSSKRKSDTADRDRSLSSLVSGAVALLERDALDEKFKNDPAAWAKYYLDADLWSRQVDIFKSVMENHNTAVAAGHGVGKSHMAAILSLWWIDIHWGDDVFLASTAPSAYQVTTILWDNMRVMHAKAKERFEKGLTHRPLHGHITGDDRYKSPIGITIGQGRKPPDDKTDVAFQGQHARWLLAIGDEAAGIEQDLFNALGNIATAQTNRVLLIANPTNPNSPMAKIWEKNLSSWNRMHISVFDSPLVTHEPGWERFKGTGMSDMSYIDSVREEWGEDSPYYITRVLGQWSFESGNNLFSDVDIAHAVNAVVVPDPEEYVQLGVDVSRSGEDWTVVYSRQEGDVWTTNENGKPVEPSDKRGMQIRLVDKWRGAPLVSSDPGNLGTAQRVHALALALGAQVVAVDASGMGTGVVDGLREIVSGMSYQPYVVVEMWGSAGSDDTRAFVNLRAQEYFGLRSDMYAGRIDIDPDDEQLIKDLQMIVYEYTDRGQQKIESKDSMKKRKVKSPDNSDAVWYARFSAEKLLGIPEKGAVTNLDEDFYEEYGKEFAGIGVW